MVQGFQGLLGSKKGVAFGATAIALLTLVTQSGLPVDLAAKLLVILAVGHMIAQGIADLRGVKEDEAKP